MIGRGEYVEVRTISRTRVSNDCVEINHDKKSRIDGFQRSCLGDDAILDTAPALGNVAAILAGVTECNKDSVSTPGVSIVRTLARKVMYNVYNSYIPFYCLGCLQWNLQAILAGVRCSKCLCRHKALEFVIFFKCHHKITGGQGTKLGCGPTGAR